MADLLRNGTAVRPASADSGLRLHRLRRQTLRVLAIALAMAVATAGMLLSMASVAVHDRLLSTSLYTTALDSSQAYERFYEEVLTDPAVVATTERLLGSLAAGQGEAADIRAVAAAGTRLLFPPVLLRELSLELVDGVLQYLRGDLAVAHTVVEAGDVFARATQTIFTQVTAFLAEASNWVFSDLEQYRAAVHAFADDLASGRVPAAVPMIGGSSFAVDDVLGIIDRATEFGLSAGVRDHVRAALASGNSRDALIDALVDDLSVKVSRMLSDVAAGALGRPDVDALTALAGRSDAPADQVLERLNDVRGAVAMFPPWARTVGLALFATGSACLVVLCRRRPGRALLAIAAVGAASVVGARIGVWWAGRQIGSPLGLLAGQRPGVVPPSVRDIMGELNAAIVADLQATVTRVAVAPLVVAAGAVVATALPGLVRRHGIVRPAKVFAAGALLVAMTGSSTDVPVRGRAPLRCNGHAELCDRPYDDVVQAATHNAMSSPDIVDVWPEQDRGIRAQLDYGVRALLIDTKYWQPTAAPDRLQGVERFLPGSLLHAVFNRSDAARADQPGTYLCHDSCARGAIDLVDALSQVRHFLDDNPDEVVTLIIQNDISSDDTTAAFEAAGLDGYLYTHQADDDWPTLGRMIHDGRRLVVFSEKELPAPEWNLPAFEYMQDTPYSAQSMDELSCDRYRGEKTASLFLLNHWVRRSAPDRADALQMNARAEIVSRARACAAVRGQLPDFIAVDFFSLGDLMGAVDELNGVDRSIV
jgi:hypothetical protein